MTQSKGEGRAAILRFIAQRRREGDRPEQIVDELVREGLERHLAAPLVAEAVQWSPQESRGQAPMQELTQSREKDQAHSELRADDGTRPAEPARPLKSDPPTEGGRAFVRERRGAVHNMRG